MISKKQASRLNIEITIGTQPLEMYALVSGTWNGINVYIGGGTDPHIGAVAISTPRPSLANPKKMSHTTSIYNCLGHKDDDIAKRFSEALCDKFHCIVVVTAGVHIDHLSSEGIRKLQELSEDLLNQVENSLLSYQ